MTPVVVAHPPQKPSASALRLFGLHRDGKVLGDEWFGGRVKGGAVVDPDDNETSRGQLQAYYLIYQLCHELVQVHPLQGTSPQDPVRMTPSVHEYRADPQSGQAQSAAVGGGCALGYGGGNLDISSGVGLLRAIGRQVRLITPYDRWHGAGTMGTVLQVLFRDAEWLVALIETVGSVKFHSTVRP